MVFRIVYRASTARRDQKQGCLWPSHARNESQRLRKPVPCYPDTQTRLFCQNNAGYLQDCEWAAGFEGVERTRIIVFNSLRCLQSSREEPIRTLSTCPLLSFFLCLTRGSSSILNKIPGHMPHFSRKESATRLRTGESCFPFPTVRVQCPVRDKIFCRSFHFISYAVAHPYCCFLVCLIRSLSLFLVTSLCHRTRR